MSDFLVYRLTTGEIIRYGECEDELVTLQASYPGEVSIPNPEDATSVTHYIAIGPPDVLTAKPENPATIDVDSIAAGNTQFATISDVPPGSEFWVNSVSQGTISDEVIEFSADVVGMYDLRLTHYRYLPARITVGVGMIELELTAEIERGADITAPLEIGGEVEGGANAEATRTAEFAAAVEVETSGGIETTVGVELALGGETESGGNMASLLDLGGEVEGGAEAEATMVATFEEDPEVEDGFDIAA